MKKITLFLLSVLFFCQNAFAQTTMVEVPISDDGKFLCIIIEVNGDDSAYAYNELGKYSDETLTSYSIVNFRRFFRIHRKKIVKLRKRIKRARRRGDTDRVNQLKAQRADVKARLNDMRDCRNKQGDYEPDGDYLPGGSGTTINSCNVIAGPEAEATSFPRIIDGTACTIGSSPIVELELFNDSGKVGDCTGTVVSSRAIITAGHCVDDVTSVIVRTGTGATTSTSLFLHPDYDPDIVTEVADVGVILTDTDLTVNQFPVISGSERLFRYENVVFAGYGRDEDDVVGIFKAGTNRIRDFDDESIWIRFDGVDESNTCDGDSGGPLLVERDGVWQLAGVVSNGTFLDCSAGDTSYFANLLSDTTRDFIDGVVTGVITD